MIHHVAACLFHSLLFVVLYGAQASRITSTDCIASNMSQNSPPMKTSSSRRGNEPSLRTIKEASPRIDSPVGSVGSLRIGPGPVTTGDPVTTGRLVIVSHRVPVPRENGSLPPGGLASGLSDAVAATPTLWFGTSGEITRELTENAPIVDNTVTYSTLSLYQWAHTAYYEGFANAYLWPLFHSLYDKVLYEGGWHRTYRKVNSELAKHLVNKLQHDDTIWIHDYHLIPLGVMLRSELKRQRPELQTLKLGFFLHIPVPSVQVFTPGVTCGANLFGCDKLKEFFKDLTAYDLIGVHTEQDERNLRHIMSVLQAPKARIETHPIGINPYEFKKEAQKTRAKANAWLQANILKRNGKQPVPAFGLTSDFILAVDRLDYTKGIPERLRALELMFRQHPELIDQVSYLQIAAPSREGVQMYKHLLDEAQAIMRTMQQEWRGRSPILPIYFHHGSVDRSIVAALCESANVGVVTPLKDGMNLFAKEYVASQAGKHPKDAGVLVLSKHAGAANELGSGTDDGALIVDPYNTQQTANAIYNALHMRPRKRIARLRKMAADVETVTATSWARNFIQSLNA